jgi:hypothetical protein
MKSGGVKWGCDISQKDRGRNGRGFSSSFFFGVRVEFRVVGGDVDMDGCGREFLVVWLQELPKMPWYL